MKKSSINITPKRFKIRHNGLKLSSFSSYQSSQGFKKQKIANLYPKGLHSYTQRSRVYFHMG